MIQYFDRSGQLISSERYVELQEDPSYRVVAYDKVSQNIWVSTIWIGFDFGFGASPMLYESIVFNGDQEHTGRRYPDEASALQGHAMLVAGAKVLVSQIH